MEWTTEQDHLDMREQLGITKLRPGPSGWEKAPNPANYDEGLANPYPEWPELLTLGDGTEVTTAESWRSRRRPELVEAFEREVVGRIPADVPGVVWSLSESATGMLGGKSVVGRHLNGRVDNASYPLIDVDISMVLVLPADAEGPVPVMVMFRGGNLRQAVGAEAPRRFGPPPGADSQPQIQDPPPGEQLIAAGWGFAWLNPASVQADHGAGLTRGIIGLVNKGQPRKPDDWGALRAWSWGAARALDYFEGDESIDAARVGIEGVSRFGKAAIVTMAFEERFAVGLIGSAGEGGVSPYRRNFGERVENLTGSGGYHWMAGNFLKYGAAESTFGAMDADDLPVDAHGLIALAAPRAVFISYGVPERGDALWLDQKGSYMAAVAAGEVFDLLGAGGLGTGEAAQSAVLPPVNQGLLTGRLAWRQHDGGHTDGPNWKYFIPWAERELGLRTRSAAAPFSRGDALSHLAHQALLAKAQSGHIDLYFVGDSITRRWGALDYPDLLDHWNRTFFGWNAGNFAWGGDRIENMLWRLANGELDGVNPKVIVIQGGTNNVGGSPGGAHKVADIRAGIAALVASCRERAPNAKLILTGIFPRSEREVIGEISAINNELAALARNEGIPFVDIGEALADAGGLLRDEYSSDGLHLSEAGYQVWADALKPWLTEWLGPPASTDSAPPPTGIPRIRGALE